MWQLTFWSKGRNSEIEQGIPDERIKTLKKKKRLAVDFKKEQLNI